VTLRDVWDAQADEWAAFARTPRHDVVHETLNLPSFLALLPPPGRKTLDLGCGEGAGAGRQALRLRPAPHLRGRFRAVKA